MNKDHNKILVDKLLEENRQLKQVIKNNKIHVNQIELTEKLNMIRFIFSMGKNVDKLSRIVLYGDFLENFVMRKPIYKKDLEFYFIITDIENSFSSKVFNILNNLDYIKRKEFNIYDNGLNKTVYSVNKNHISFKMSFFNYNPNFINFFNIQNIELDNVYGLKVKKITSDNTINNISDGVISLIDIFKSLYLTTTSSNANNINQNNLSYFIGKQQELMYKGFKIKNGVKIVNLGECSICYEVNLKGVLLCCGHSFCIDCICKHLDISNNNPEYTEKKCPLCRDIIDLVFE